MKFRVMMHVEIDAKDYPEAFDHAKKLLELFKDPFARMTIAASGVKLVNGDGAPVVYKPKPA